jgi:hypothetical protein
MGPVAGCVPPRNAGGKGALPGPVPKCNRLLKINNSHSNHITLAVVTWKKKTKQRVIDNNKKEVEVEEGCVHHPRKSLKMCINKLVIYYGAACSVK